MGIKTGSRLRVTTLQVLHDTNPRFLPRPQLDRDVFMATGRRVMHPIIPAGTTYEGIASDVDPDGFFDLNLANGSVLGFCAFDSSIRWEEI